MKWFVVAAIVLLTLVTPVFANNLTVVSDNAAWQQINSPTNGPFTWVLPAVIAGCGAENETSCEPAGHWLLNQPASGFAEYVEFDEFYDSTTGEYSGPSDYILFGNNPNTGNFEVWFFSDPNLLTVNADGSITWDGSHSGCDPLTSASCVQYANGNGGPACAESLTNFPDKGCVVGQGIQGLQGLTITLASDGEAGFDPFVAGYDTSDGISFTGVSAPQNPVPEPTSLVLLGTGLLGLLRKRFVA